MSNFIINERERIKNYILKILDKNGNITQERHKSFLKDNNQDALFFQSEIDRLHISYATLKIFVEQNVYDWPKCAYCGKDIEPHKIKMNFKPVRIKKIQYCNDRCANRDPLTHEKIKQTRIKKHGSVEEAERIRLQNVFEGNKRNNGGIHLFQTEDFKHKMKELNQTRYGVDHHSQTQEFQDKLKQRNNGFKITSKEEQKIYHLLLEKYPNTKNHYKHRTLYPWFCDFYVPELDLWIEYQGYWTHGKEPYDEKNEEHSRKVNEWREKLKTKSSWYGAAIKSWTTSDPLKRKIAKENGLNWIEFFNMKQFKEWFETI